MLPRPVQQVYTHGALSSFPLRMKCYQRQKCSATKAMYGRYHALGYEEGSPDVLKVKF